MIGFLSRGTMSSFTLIAALVTSFFMVGDVTITRASGDGGKARMKVRCTGEIINVAGHKFGDKETILIYLDANTSVVTIACNNLKDATDVMAISAKFSNGVVSDSSWKVADSLDNWAEASYEDPKWKQATVRGDVLEIGRYPRVLPGASWIGSSRSDERKERLYFTTKLDLSRCYGDVQYNCSYLCFVNSVNSSKHAQCRCPAKLQLAKDNSSCVECDHDTLECLMQNSKCRNHSNVCECEEGYRREDDTCVDIDECEESSSKCEQTCTNTIGSYNCSCLPGFKPTGNRCACANDDHTRHGDECFLHPTSIKIACSGSEVMAVGFVDEEPRPLWNATSGEDGMFSASVFNGTLSGIAISCRRDSDSNKSLAILAEFSHAVNAVTGVDWRMRWTNHTGNLSEWLAPNYSASSWGHAEFLGYNPQAEGLLYYSQISNDSAWIGLPWEKINNNSQIQMLYFRMSFGGASRGGLGNHSYFLLGLCVLLAGHYPTHWMGWLWA